MAGLFGGLPNLRFSGEFGNSVKSETADTYYGENVVKSSFLTNVFTGTLWSPLSQIP